MTIQFFVQSLPPNTAQLLNDLADTKSQFLSSFYLSGGTALSLLLGHRESEDLDFFSEHTFQPQKIEQELVAIGDTSDTELDKGTLNTYINGVKLQFLEYPYPLLSQPLVWKGIKVSSTLDIALTKLQTISARGSKKDFVDLYYLLETYSLSTLFQSLKIKYPHTSYNETHIFKSLVYFKDADKEPMPRMNHDITWQDIKNMLINKVKAFDITSAKITI